MAKILSDALFDALREAGLADTNTRRVVIDLQARHVPVVHIEKYGDESMFRVVQALDGVHIDRVDRYNDELPEWERDLLTAQAAGEAHTQSESGSTIKGGPTE